MINYIKNQLKNIPMMILICILFYGIVTIATSNINSNDITFDNTNSNLNAGDMQEAIDEVFQHATDYNEIKTTIGDSTLTTTNQTLTGAVNEVNGKITCHEKSISFTDGSKTYANYSDLGMTNVKDVIIFPNQWKGDGGRSYYAVKYFNSNAIIIYGHVGWNATGTSIGSETNTVRYCVIHV